MPEGVPHLVVLTGSGISAESGIRTFRETGGLWEEYDVMEVASIEGWMRNPELVLNFYNQRRKQAWHAQPNEGHKALVDLEERFQVSIITQNVDRLHERAGSSRVIHLHGDLHQGRSESINDLIVELEDRPITIGDLSPAGDQLRPNIVWFGEPVYAMEQAMEIAAQAEIFAVIGTSLQVYPAAGLLHGLKEDIPIFVVDPERPAMYSRNENVHYIQEKASTGVPKLAELIKTQF
jgi:NAD-dependent deacetylase